MFLVDVFMPLYLILSVEKDPNRLGFNFLYAPKLVPISKRILLLVVPLGVAAIILIVSCR